MFRVELMFVLCVLVVVTTLVQPGSAWWWKKQNCPQQEHCPLTCVSGYVVDAKDNGCKVQLCRCNDVCEHFNCPDNTECRRKFHCKRWGGCSVYATCVLIKDVKPKQSPDESVPETTQRTTRTTPVTTTNKPTTTTVVQETTTKTAGQSGGEAITKKTALPMLCLDRQEPLQGWNCDVTLLRGRPCPTNYRCEKESSGGIAICCPAQVILGQPPRPTGPVFTERTPSPSKCSDGKPELADWNCGRGGKRCPDTHKCLIHPADRYAVCCPIPVRADQPNRTPVTRSALPMCEQPVQAGFCKASLPRWHFNSATGLCEFFRYGGCEGNANNFRSQEACERSCGGPGESYCSLPSEVGRCRAAFRRYFFDQSTGECTQFIYGGCEGNGNNFRTIDQCEQFCS